jgi:hypothetical protein
LAERLQLIAVARARFFPDLFVFTERDAAERIAEL